MSFRRIQDPPADARPWVAWLLAAGVTLMLFLSMGLSAASVRSGRLLQGVVPRSAPDRPEHLVFQTLPRSTTPAAEPETPSSAEAPARPSTTPSARAPAAAPVAQPRTAPDSGSSAGATRRPATSTPKGIPPLDPRLAFPVKPTPPIGTDAAAPCTAPCGVAGRAGASLSKRALTRAQRDSVLRALSASIPAAAVLGGGGAGDSSGMGGISIPIPLPGGGPSREQRQHDSTVNAHVLPILERLRRRADSVRAARRRDSLEAIAKQRDSTTIR